MIRKKLKFKGLLISDDISMKALNMILLLMQKIREAGCNLVFIVQEILMTT